jgi:hypothetical protein
VSWSLVVVTSGDGTPLGELRNPTERSLSERLRRPTTTTFKLNLREPLADVLLDGNALVKMYESDPVFTSLFGAADQLRFHGEVVDAEESCDEQSSTVKVTCADPLYALTDRLVGKSTEGYKPTAQRGAIAAAILDSANGEGNTLLRLGTVQIGTTTTAGPWHYKPALEAIAELAAAMDGFDYRVRPVEPTHDAQGLYIGLLDIVANQGTYREDAIFEFGTGRHNVRRYKRPTTKQGQLNRGYALPPGFPENAGTATVVTASDADSIATWRLREGVIPQDLADQALRQQLVDRHVQVRHEPRETITFEPFPTGYQRHGKPVPVPRFKVDYDTGDTVIFRAVKHGRVRANAAMRAYGVDVAISDKGIATPSPILQPGD